MTLIDVTGLDHRSLNEKLRDANGPVTLTGCCGQRFIAAGMSGPELTVEGIPGNALGAYLNGASITVDGNAQDAVGDTMNEGRIIVRGSIGDAAGYAMRGGQLFVRNNAGYRAGIHMKAYKDKVPLLIIGGTAGSFLGEYQAGGVIIILGLGRDKQRIVGNFPCTGMHGGKLFLRCTPEEVLFPSQVTASPASPDDLEELRQYLIPYCQVFNLDLEEILASPFTVAVPCSSNPYKQMYVSN